MEFRKLKSEGTYSRNRNAFPLLPQKVYRRKVRGRLLGVEWLASRRDCGKRVAVLGLFREEMTSHALSF